MRSLCAIGELRRTRVDMTTTSATTDPPNETAPPHGTVERTTQPHDSNFRFTDLALEAVDSTDPTRAVAIRSAITKFDSGQREFLEHALAGHNVYLDGAPGCGKVYMLSRTCMHGHRAPRTHAPTRTHLHSHTYVHAHVRARAHRPLR